MSTQGTRWTREQLIEVLSLYWQLPFGQFDARTVAVRKLAVKLGRTGGAVAMKLNNLASFDPELAARGIRGLRGASRLDRAIWDEFYGGWPELAAQEATDVATDSGDFARRTATPDNQHESSRTTTITNTERLALVWVRRGQQFFRQAVLAMYEYRCCVTGIVEQQLLRASHIRPWARCDAVRQLDPRNGLCLNAIMDLAFDAGLMSVDSDRRVVYSRRLRKTVTGAAWTGMFGQWEGATLSRAERMDAAEEYLRYHRTEVFQGT